MPLWVYWDKLTRRVRIHRGECRCCNDGKGMHPGSQVGRGKQFHWFPARSYQDAKRTVRERTDPRKGEPIDCGHCLR
jgi:hypothetical protein